MAKTIAFTVKLIKEDRFVPVTGEPKEGMPKQYVLLHPIFLLRKQAVAYHKAMKDTWLGDTTVVRVEINEKP